MKRMKKIKKKAPIALFIILIFCFGWKLCRNNFSGDIYYTKIQVIPDKKTEEDSNGNYKCFYDYVKNAYSYSKEIKTVNFKELCDYPLKLNTYLRLVVNSENKVVSREKIKKEDIPPKVLDQIAAEN
jgi:uncharacterized protein (TIGR01655 family)